MSTRIDPIERGEATTPPGGSPDLGTTEQVVRAMAAEVSTTATQVEGLVDDTRRNTRDIRGVRASAVLTARTLGALDRRVERRFKGVEERLDETAAELVVLQAHVGQPPNPEAIGRASSQDLSPDAIAKLELGTGLYGALAKLTVAHLQAARREGEDAGRREGEAAGKRAGTRRGAVVGGSAAIAIAAITHADKIEHLVRWLVGG